MYFVMIIMVTETNVEFNSNVVFFVEYSFVLYCIFPCLDKKKIVKTFIRLKKKLM